MNFLEQLSLTRTIAGEYLKLFEYPFLALVQLNEFISSTGEKLEEEYNEISPRVWVHKSAKIANTACICPPCIIGENSEIRHSAYIRGSVIVGKGCVVGNSTEVKNSILFDGVQLPHFNYAGDSILGFKAHLGAGAIISNVKSDKSDVTVKGGGVKIDTGLKKLGAIIGDGVEVGCNSVINPGTVICKNTSIYPLSNVRGIIPQNSIFKNCGKVVLKN